METGESRARKAFEGLGQNFLTPEVLGYRDFGPFVVEISTGEFFDRIWGVTVRRPDGSVDWKCVKLSKVFFTDSEAYHYLTVLEKVARREEAGEDDLIAEENC